MQSYNCDLEIKIKKSEECKMKQVNYTNARETKICYSIYYVYVYVYVLYVYVLYMYMYYTYMYMYYTFLYRR